MSEIDLGKANHFGPRNLRSSVADFRRVCVFDVELVAAVISVAAGMMVRPSDFFRGNDRPQLRP